MSLTTTDLLGPLTTVWTPPAACLETATYNPNAIWAPDESKSLSPAVLLGATGQAADLVCYPPKFTANHVYSPGICPSGWTSACEPNTGAGKTLISAPTSGVQCCPSGLICSEVNWCVHPSATVGPVWSLYTDKYGIEGALMTTVFPTLKVQAKPIFVAYQSSDKKALDAAATQAAARTGSSQSTTTIVSQGSSLSGGTIAGIAIGSAIGGVLIATVLTFICLRFCLGYRRTKNSGEKLRGESEHELHSSAAKRMSPQQSSPRQGWRSSEYELDTSSKRSPPLQPESPSGWQSPASELAAARQNTSELSAAGHSRAELDAKKG